MTRHLLIRIRLHDSRYHGMGEWGPSPARLFQALVAAAARGALIDEDSGAALEWLETLTPPIIGLPTMRAGRRFAQFGPDNDIDSVGREPRRVDEIRSSKTIEPKLLNRDVPFLYAWAFEEDEISGVNSQAICSLANGVYQFGRGVDMAWAACELLDTDQIETRLSGYVGVVYRPSDHRDGRKLACPKPGSLKSLRERYAGGSRRFTTVGIGKAIKELFSQPPKARFLQVSYGSPTSRRLYDLRGVTPEASFRPWPLSEVSRLITLLRDLAVERLRDAFPDRTPEIERVVVGRKADGSDDGPPAVRVRIIPLPSIGHHHADRQIRRVVVEVPPGCPFREDDIHWAFSGLEIVDRDTGEILDILTPSTDETMLRHYGLATRARDRVWRSVTPVALPESAKRRRIEPSRISAEAKDGTERADEQGRAAAAVVQALRHSEVRTRAEMIRVQREPFEAKGERVEKFAPGTRFAKERLWHVEVTFSESVAGPLVIGDGRFLGLGVMAPVKTDRGIQAFVIEDGLSTTTEGTEVTRALRRAVMARVQSVVGLRTSLPTFFTGHERDGSAAKTEQYPHLTFVYDPGAQRLLIIAPHVVERRAAKRDESRHLRILETALTEFRELRAGSSGHLTLRPSSIDAYSDPLFGASRTWESVTPYQVTRHKKHVGAGESLSEDLRAECRRRGLPEPHVMARDLRGVPGVGLVGSARLSFEVAVNGPIVLGRSRHLGGGLFVGVTP